jgi:hypothetical protein
MFAKERLRVCPYECYRDRFRQPSRATAFASVAILNEIRRVIVMDRPLRQVPLESGDKKSTLRCFSQFPDMVREIRK